MFLTVHISSNFKFESFHAGVRCFISSLSKNHITTLIVGQELKKQFGI